MRDTPPVSCGIHGEWQYYGEYFGWLRSDLAEPGVLKLLLNNPWNVVTEPPSAELTRKAWHALRLDRARVAMAEYIERKCMAKEDSHDGSRGNATLDPLHNNVAENPDELARYNSNSELQRSNPCWYGPYLDEGEAYLVPRTTENITKACTDLGLDNLKEEWKGECVPPKH